MTTNTKEDVELMVAWIKGVCRLNSEGRQFIYSERNLAILDEIIACIKASQEKKKTR